MSTPSHRASGSFGPRARPRADEHRPPGPVRTCLGCRVRSGKSELVRIGLEEGAPVLDRAARLTGRGVYVHPHKSCIERLLRLLKAGKLSRALRTPVHSAHTSALRQSLTAFSASLASPCSAALVADPEDAAIITPSGVHPEAALPPCPPTLRKRNQIIAERMSSTTIETPPQAQPAPTIGPVKHVLTRPTVVNELSHVGGQ